MPEIDLRIDEYAADRIRQAVADGIQGGLTDARAQLQVSPPSRDALAAKAMEGYLASTSTMATDPKPEAVARFAYAVADAMLAERERRAAEGPSRG